MTKTHKVLFWVEMIGGVALMVSTFLSPEFNHWKFLFALMIIVAAANDRTLVQTVDIWKRSAEEERKDNFNLRNRVREKEVIER